MKIYESLPKELAMDQVLGATMTKERSSYFQLSCDET
jgi:hypothetical protein